MKFLHLLKQVLIKKNILLATQRMDIIAYMSLKEDIRYAMK